MLEAKQNNLSKIYVLPYHAQKQMVAGKHVCDCVESFVFMCDWFLPRLCTYEAADKASVGLIGS